MYANVHIYTYMHTYIIQTHVSTKYIRTESSCINKNCIHAYKHTYIYTYAKLHTLIVDTYINTCIAAYKRAYLITYIPFCMPI